jgi:predicted enzyme involved in methoxymalonyl-ACP biosynthesis
VSLAVKDGVGQIVDFVLSCRVMGRNVEEALVYMDMPGLQDSIAFAEYIPLPRMLLP